MMYQPALLQTPSRRPGSHASSTSSSDHATTEYWKQHGALKMSYLDDVHAVYAAFQKILGSRDLDERRKIAHLIEYVSFCKQVLEEDAATHAIRTWEELARVRKYISNIVVPYVTKLSTDDLPERVEDDDTMGRDSMDSLGSPPQHETNHVKVMWTGRRHGDLGQRPQFSLPPPSVMDDRSSMTSSENTYASYHTENGMDYWRSHGALKDAHFANVLAVHAAFKQHLSRPGAVQNEQRQKIEYLMGYVEFCLHVLQETPSSHPPRSNADLRRLTKSIHKIITPYMHKLTQSSSLSSVSSASGSKMLPSMSDQLFAVKHQNPTMSPNLRDDRQRRLDAYWQQHTQLKQLYLASVGEAYRFFQMYLQQYRGHKSPEHIQDVVHLFEYADYCGQVLEETPATHAPRDIKELEHVYTYITTVIEPHFKKLQTEVNATLSPLRDTFLSTEISLPSLAPSNVSSAAPRTDSSFSSAASDATSQHVYWRKHAALKEIYGQKVGMVLQSFQKYVQAHSQAKSATEARKLARLYEMLEQVEFCCGIFAETDRTHPPREIAELDAVHQCITQVVIPYCQSVDGGDSKAIF
ncbi:hypothetical protein SPRG_13821 [Saprolegnia parasitica CBS 223.65]|uniref:Uncharacterized protein n=1 Tax=Saprolegnia parasitica (strain CBS 223.65) TaxID=695850 RepID=A0A067BWA4_SAPPC|nr:hypothetical protein SPRG_13821 [Saprolegnia parasitica CBS 223.65]KDO21115.1 hypothetical protein SPRG_13821 [Saprolegnia parasitica CBS 223.65]|eukprot:XP_012208207.1 hypothetical protein SPRG_13821 [Saprolegnia parasitica CBS 223.65]